MTLKLSVLDGSLAICRLEPSAEIPTWVLSQSFYTLSRTAEEISVVCPEAAVPDGITCERGWRGLKVAGPLDFSLTGVLAAIAAPLAQAKISIFALSTFDTDYVLVKTEKLELAITALEGAGHKVYRTGEKT